MGAKTPPKMAPKCKKIFNFVHSFANFWRQMLPSAPQDARDSEIWSKKSPQDLPRPPLDLDFITIFNDFDDILKEFSSCFAFLFSFALLCFALLCFAFYLLCCAPLCVASLCFALLRFALLCFALLCFALLCPSLCITPSTTLSKQCLNPTTTLSKQKLNPPSTPSKQCYHKQTALSKQCLHTPTTFSKQCFFAGTVAGDAKHLG